MWTRALNPFTGVIAIAYSADCPGITVAIAGVAATVKGADGDAGTIYVE